MRNVTIREQPKESRRSGSSEDLREQLRKRLKGEKKESKSGMGRRESGEDLRSKLEKKKVDVKPDRSRWNEDNKSSTEEYSRDSKKHRNKENKKSEKRDEYKREARRSESRERRRRSRDPSRDRHERSHHSPVSSSASRKPLKEKMSEKRDRSRDRSERKRKLSPKESPKKVKQRKSHSVSSVEITPKKKKKSAVDSEEKVKKKKKKKTKDKKLSKKKSKSEDIPTEELTEKIIAETDFQDPKGRKSRVDSGISTGSVLNGETLERKLESVSRRAESKVSDSPLSGTSLSLSPSEANQTSPTLKKENLVKEHAEILTETPEVAEESKQVERKDKKKVKKNNKKTENESENTDQLDSGSPMKKEDEEKRGKHKHSVESKERNEEKRDHSRSNKDYSRSPVKKEKHGDRRERTPSRKRERTPTKRRERTPIRRRDRTPIRRDGTPSRRDRIPSRRERTPSRRERTPSKRERTPLKREKTPLRNVDRSNRSPRRREGSLTEAVTNTVISPKKQDTSGMKVDHETAKQSETQIDPIRSTEESVTQPRNENAENASQSTATEEAEPKTNSCIEDRLMEIAGKTERTPIKERRHTVDEVDPRRNGRDRRDSRERRDYRSFKSRSPHGSRTRDVDSRHRRLRSPDRRRDLDRRSPRQRRDRSRDWRDRERYSREREYGDRRYESRDYSRRYSTDTRETGTRASSWEDKVQEFISKIGVTSNLRELPRDKREPLADFDPSRPPPLNLVPEHQSNYIDSAFPTVDYSSEHASHIPPFFEPSIARGPQYSPDPEIHTGISVDESLKRSSRERDLKPLSNKEKKRMEIAQKDIWKYVAGCLMQDRIFLKRKKKRADSEEEDLKEKAEKCTVRIALKLEKAGFKESRLWKMLRDNEAGVEGFVDEMKVEVMNDNIEVDYDSKKIKDRMDADLLKDGSFFRYIGQFIQDSITGKHSRDYHQSLSSSNLQGLEAVSSNTLQNILHTAFQLPAPVSAQDPRIQNQGESSLDFAIRSFSDLQKFICVHLVQTLNVDIEKAREISALYVESLAKAEFNILTLEDAVKNYTPPPPEFEGEPEQTVYGYLLEIMRGVPFDRYPRQLTDGDLDTHQTNIVRISLDYFNQVPKPRTPSPKPSIRAVGEEEDGFIGPMPHIETVPVGGNTESQLPQRRYVLMSVAVDTVSVDGRLVVWQISVHIPGLPEDEDPDYECLMVPIALMDKPHVLSELGFTFDAERNKYYHQGTEFSRRKAEMEESSMDKFANYLDEIRSGMRGAGNNNGLVLLFETGEDLSLVQQLFAKHSHDVFYDVVKGVSCLDHYLRVSRPGRPASYTWPSYQFKVGEGAKWTATITNSGNVSRLDADTKPECIYKICEGMLGSPPSFINFIKWFSYPILHPEISRMTASLEHTLELLPLQNFIDRQLFTNRVQVTLEGVFAARSEVEASRPHSACARQTIRRLVSLGFNQDVLKKSFQVDPNYDIPTTVFLQDMTEVQKLRLHEQTDQIRQIIKQFFGRH